MNHSDATTSTDPRTAPRTAAQTERPRQLAGDADAAQRWRRTGGAAGLFFAASVIVQNLVRGTDAPAVGASAEEVQSWAAGATVSTALVTVLVALNLVALGLFVGAVVQEAWGRRPALAVAGLFGVAGLMAMFLVTALVPVVVVARAADLEDGVLVGLMAVHDAAFSFSHPALGLALAALGLAGVAAGITPRAFAVLAPLGGALLVLAGAAAYWVVGGSPLLVAALAGFLLWVAFLVATGLRLVRRTPPATH
ncbi:hypothetical protein [Nocardioides coralli]|uniref:hypothetical protein n=1 Tax=Nocardioides coralli TaxID=2872154 RepID=UPI001CA44585|nr:hypothetical protein [Nocardioides coralli]QZY28750.1 hypothetical protein K6T13_15015 [Nocardioides coralli]